MVEGGGEVVDDVAGTLFPLSSSEKKNSKGVV